MQIRCPHCQNPIEVVQDDSLMDVDCPSCGSSFNLASDTETISHEAADLHGAVLFCGESFVRTQFR